VAETGGRLAPRAVLAADEQIEPVVEAERYRSYREVLTESAVRVAHQLGWALPPARGGFLAESLPRWIPFPDTNAALERLFKAGYQLGILSNVDDDLLEATRRHFTVPFDLIVTAQQVGSYKPADGHFLTARRRIGGRPWLHAARSHFHDVTPCRRLGIPVAWINRAGEPGREPRPDRELATLTALADWLT
jgi:2-haloalkanoic acid dehalogenase type II